MLFARVVETLIWHINVDGDEYCAKGDYCTDLPFSEEVTYWHSDKGWGEMDEEYPAAPDTAWLLMDFMDSPGVEEFVEEFTVPPIQENTGASQDKLAQTGLQD